MDTIKMMTDIGAIVNPQGYVYYMNYLVKKYGWWCEVVDNPFEIVRISPSDVNYRKKDTIDKWKSMGEIRDGEWDKNVESIWDSTVYRSLIDRYEYGEPWENTDIYKKTLYRIDAGESYWNGCSTVKDLEARTEQIDTLYSTIKEDGYKSQTEIYGKTPKERVLSTGFRRSKTEVAISIGRDGTLILTDGHHRLAIAKTLDIESVPARIVVRHKLWGID